MGKIVVSQFMTVDGVVEDPGGAEDFERGGWAFQYERGEEGDQFKLDEVMASDALLLGRRTYEGFAAVAGARGRLRRQVQRHEEVRRHLHAEQSGVEQHPGDLA